jgi:formyltetrahydrofolate hydrolase
MRVEFELAEGDAMPARWIRGLMPKNTAWTWTDARRGERGARSLLMVSKFDHCLGDLLYRTASANCRWTWSASSATTRAKR